jgi:glycosyltransferase involved in cell wall biosynthesis
MSSGRAVVACDVGAIASALVDGRTGLLVAPGDAGALAAAIESLAGDPALRARLAAAARAHVAQEFELHLCTRRLRRHLEAAYA